MKEYGKDLKKQYNKVLELEVALSGKIKKRYEFLIKNAELEILNQTKLNFITDPNDINIEDLLNKIIAIEQVYVSQSKQLNMFQ